MDWWGVMELDWWGVLSHWWGVVKLDWWGVAKLDWGEIAKTALKNGDAAVLANAVKCQMFIHMIYDEGGGV